MERRKTDFRVRFSYSSGGFAKFIEQLIYFTNTKADRPSLIRDTESELLVDLFRLRERLSVDRPTNRS